CASDRRVCARTESRRHRRCSRPGYRRAGIRRKKAVQTEEASRRNMTRIFSSLPLSNGNPLQASGTGPGYPAKAMPVPGTLPVGNVLVVEDDPDVREMLTVLL